MLQCHNVAIYSWVSINSVIFSVLIVSFCCATVLQCYIGVVYIVFSVIFINCNIVAVLHGCSVILLQFNIDIGKVRGPKKGVILSTKTG